MGRFTAKTNLTEVLPLGHSPYLQPLPEGPFPIGPASNVRAHAHTQRPVNIYDVVEDILKGEGKNGRSNQPLVISASDVLRLKIAYGAYESSM